MMLTYILIVSFSWGGLEQARFEMPGWASLQQCQSAGDRVRAEWTAPRDPEPLMVNISCEAQQ